MRPDTRTGAGRRRPASGGKPSGTQNSFTLIIFHTTASADHTTGQTIGARLIRLEGFPSRQRSRTSGQTPDGPSRGSADAHSRAASRRHRGGVCASRAPQADDRTPAVAA